MSQYNLRKGGRLWFHGLCAQLLCAELPDDFVPTDQGTGKGDICDGWAESTQSAFAFYCPDDRPREDKLRKDIKRAAEADPKGVYLVLPVDLDGPESKWLRGHLARARYPFKVHAWGEQKLNELLNKHQHVRDGFFPESEGAIQHEILLGVRSLLGEQPPCAALTVHGLAAELADQKVQLQLQRRKTRRAEQRALRAQLELADGYQDAEKPDKALAAYDQIIGNEVTRRSRKLLAAAHNNKGKVLLDLGRAEEALAAIAEAVRLDPKRVEIVANQATAAHALGKHEEALALCERAEQLDPKYAPLHAVRGTALMHTASAGKALPHLEKAVKLDSEEGWFWFNLALARERLGDREGALKALWESARPRRDFPRGRAAFHELRLQPGVEELSPRQLKLALRECLWIAATARDELARGFDSQAELRTALNASALAHWQLRELDDALECFRKVRCRWPSATSAYNLGLSYHTVGDVENSIKALEEAKELGIEASGLALNLACQYAYRYQLTRDRADLERAAALIKEAEAAEPGAPEMALNKAGILLAQDEPREAEGVWRGLLRQEREGREPRIWLEARLNYAWLLVTEGRLDEAEGQIDAAQSEFPREADPLVAKGQFEFEDRQNRDEACALFEGAEHREGPHPHRVGQYYVTWADAERDDLRKLDILQRGLDKHPSNAPARRQITTKMDEVVDKQQEPPTILRPP